MDDTTPTHIVVYGTLMTGQRAHRLMVACEVEGTVKVPGTMYELVGFPGVKLGGKSTFRGELYKLPDDLTRCGLTIQRLDSYESCPPMYTRRVVDVEHGGRQLKAFVYEFNGQLPDEDIVPSGNWHFHQRFKKRA